MKSVEINVTLKQKAERFISLNERHTLCILVKEATTTGVFNVRYSQDVEALEITAVNKEFIKRGLGQKTIVIAAATIDAALELAKAQKYNMLCHSFEIADNTKVVEFVKAQVNDYKNPIMCVLANTVANFKNIINFATDNIKVGSTTFTAEQYTSRIASAIVNVPTTESATYLVLDEIDSVPLLTKDELDALIMAGKLVLIDDGEKVKIARGVTSLTTLTNDTEDSQSIRLVTIGNIITRDIQQSVSDKYVGKVIGTYANKMNICTEIKAYLSILARQQLVDVKFDVDIDVEAIKTYLNSIGIVTDGMTDEELRHYNTKRKCFILCRVSLLDSMEDFYINVEA